MEKEMILNQLPAKTWYWLKMNSSRVQAELPEITVLADAIIPESLSFSDEEAWSGFETGLGHEADALFADAFVPTLHVAEEQKVESPVILRYEYPEDAAADAVLQIKAEENSSVSVIILLKGESSATAAHRILVDAAEGASVTIYAAQLFGADVKAFCDFGSRHAKNAEVHLIRIESGAEQIYAGGYADLTGTESFFGADTAYMAKSGGRTDLNYVAKHIGLSTRSNMQAFGVIKENGTKLFRGTIDFVKGGKGAKGDENEEVLMLGDHVVNQTIPLILCAEEDVEGTHGASIGSLDESMLFYLSTRGFSKEEAERLVARARLDAVADRFPDETVREEIAKELEALND